MHGTIEFLIGPFVVVVAAGFLFSMVLIVALALRATRSRGAQFAQFAAARGFSYQERLPYGRPPRLDLSERVYATSAAESFLRQFGECPLFNSGTWRDVRNVVSGKTGERHWLVFDYHHWSESRAQSESEVVQTTCVVLHAGRLLGRFSVEPKLPILGFLMARMDVRTLVKTGDAHFDSKFIVRSTDPPRTLGLLKPPVRTYALTLYQSPKKYYRQLYVHECMIIVTEFSAPVRHIPDMMEIAEGFLNSLTTEHNDSPS